MLHEPFFLARRCHDGTSVGDLMSPFQKNLTLGRTEFPSDFLHDRINRAACVMDQRSKGTISLNDDALERAKLDDGFCSIIDIRVDLDLKDNFG